MKSAEEFVRDGDWRSYETAIASIKARDLEMWKQGITDAAKECRALCVEHFIPERLEYLRDQTKGV